MSIEESQTPRAGFPKAVPNTPTNVLEQFSMKGKVIVVTGAADGIGGAVADAMAEAGGSVALWYNSNEEAVRRAETLAKQHGVKTKAYKVNSKLCKLAEADLN
jgi:sorbose reductase